jgi:hypothetical protein
MPVRGTAVSAKIHIDKINAIKKAASMGGFATRSIGLWLTTAGSTSRDL